MKVSLNTWCPPAAPAPEPAPAPAPPAASLTGYGTVNVGVGADSGGPGRKWSTNNAAFPNALGVKGELQVGGQATAFFQVEHRAGPDLVFKPHTQVVGLRHPDAGELKLGRQDGPLRAVTPDAFGGDTVGGRGERRAGAGDRYSSGVVYTTPTRRGVTASVGVALPDGETPRAGVAGTVKYERDGVTLAAGVAQRSNGDRAFAAGATWKLDGGAQVMAAVAHNDGHRSGLQRSTLDLGAVLPVSEDASVRLKYNLDRHDGSTTQNVGVGYWHKLGEDTMLYANAGAQLGGGSEPGVAVDAGLRITF